MFHYVDLETLCLATEDPERVKSALVFAASLEEPELIIEELKGYHGNTILKITLHIKRNPEIKSFFSGMKEAGLLERVLADLDSRFDDDLVLNIRLNKQEAYLEKFVLFAEQPEGGAISIRAKAKAFPARREAGLEVVKDYFASL